MKSENWGPPIRFFAMTGSAFLLATSFHASAENGSSEYTIRSMERISAETAQLILDSPPNHTLQFWMSTNLNEWFPTGPLPTIGYNGTTATYHVPVNPERPHALFQVEYFPIPPAPVPVAQLDAPETEPATQHLPEMSLVPENESETITENGVITSLAHLLVTVDPLTTVGDLNQLLATEGLAIAGTIPSMNLVKLRRGEITTLEDMESQLLRLMNSGLFESVALNLGFIPELPTTRPIPQLNAAYPQEPLVHWTWEHSPLGKGSGGNSAFEMSRIPQLWNWLDHGYRTITFNGSHDVAVMELAFNNHRDLPPFVTLQPIVEPSLTGEYASHGTAVIGVIAALHDSTGIQGVTPLANHVYGVRLPVATTTYGLYEDLILQAVEDLLTKPNPPRIINISAGVNYAGTPTDANKRQIDDMGKTWAEGLDNLYDVIDHEYLIVCTAGNDGGINARYSNPRANIACRPDLLLLAPNVLVVENVQADGTPFTDPEKGSNFDSDGNGHAVSAGGTDVAVLFGPQDTQYQVVRGTSFSAPFVAGLASFLWSLEPTLSTFELKSLLMGTNTTFEVQSGQRANLVDAFSAVLEIDRLRQNHDRHRALVDVDDGTLDGNLREEIIYYSEDPDQIHTYDGRRGDGLVNMKDFRVFRDAWLQVIGEADYLDGPPTHFKRDLNFDGLVHDQPASPTHPAPYGIVSISGPSLDEKIYSRYDFNGNGLLDPENQSASPPIPSLAPFKADPDTEVTGRNLSKQIYRDIDVLLDPAIWDQDDENVVLTSSPPYPSTLPMDWTTNTLSTLYVNDLQSFDFHIDMEGGNPDAVDDDYLDYPYLAVFQEGLEIDSFGALRKGRLGEWEGVITVPYDIIFDFPTVTVQYRKTQGNEFHQYFFSFLAQKGEDIGLSLGFDELQFFSNTRLFTGYYLEDASNPISSEVIAKTPGSGTYGGFFIPLEEATSEEIKNRARAAAISVLADRLLFPTALNGSPSFEAIYTTDGMEGGVFVEILGIEANYNLIEGTPREQQN